MPQPPAYTIATDFSADESGAVAGRSTVRTTNVDTEFTNIKAFVDQMRTNVALSQADDGSPKDDWVDLPSLADDVINWVTTNGNGWYETDTGSVNTMVVTLDPAATTLTNGLFVVTDIKLTNTSTAVTLNVNGLGAKAVVTDGAGALPSVGALTIGTFYGFQYDLSATKFQIVFSGDSIAHSTAAATSATAAASSATASASSATAAAASYDSFDDRYLGTKSSDPSVDNDGATLLDGALYFNTSTNVMMVYDLGGTTWNRTTPTSADQTKINTVSGIASDVTAVAAKATEIGRLGTADAVADMAILGTSDVVTDMNTLGTADVVTDMNVLGTADVVSDMNTLATSAIVTDMDLLATSANVTAMGLLGTSANVTAIGLLGTSAVITDLGILGTADVVTDMNVLATADVVTDMNVLGTSDVVTDMNVLGTADVVNDMNVLGTSGNVTNMNTLSGISANITTVAGISANVTTAATNEASINRYSDEYTIASSAPGSPSEGDLWYDSSNNILKVHNGSSFVAVTSATAGITDVVDDTTPELGGDLSLNGNNIDFPTTPNISDCLDEDTMSSNSATKICTQQSIKAYVDAIEASEITTAGVTFSNYNTISANVSTTTASTKNMFLMGTISVTGTAVWTIAGNGALTII